MTEKEKRERGERKNVCVSSQVSCDIAKFAADVLPFGGFPYLFPQVLKGSLHYSSPLGVIFVSQLTSARCRERNSLTKVRHHLQVP